MAYQEMYKLPLINAPVPTSALNLPVGNEKGFMYKLPKIQDSSKEEEINPLKELEDRQEAILQKLEALKDRVQSMKQNSGKTESGMLDIVIHCSYQSPPQSIPLACRWMQEKLGLKIYTSCHLHSSVKSLPQNLMEFLPPSNCTSRMQSNVRFTVIWKENVGRDPECYVTMLPAQNIKGEVNLLRFLNRQFGLLTSTTSTAAIESRLDEWLDRIHSNIIWGQNSNLEDILKDIEKSVSSQNFIIDSKMPGIVDLIAYASINDSVKSQKQSKTIKKYLDVCKAHFGLQQQASGQNIRVVN